VIDYISGARVQSASHPGAASRQGFKTRKQLGSYKWGGQYLFHDSLYVGKT